MSEKYKYRVSKLKVLKSNAGYYIGRTAIYEDGEEQPYSRDSNYFINKEAAEKELKTNGADYL